MWLLVYKNVNLTNSYFQQRFSIGSWGQVAAERKGVECVERQ